MAKRITDAAIKKEIRNTERRIKTIEKHTGAKITIDKDAILSSPNKAKALADLKKVSWKTLQQGRGFKKDFINMKVEGRYWNAKAGFIETETEVQGQDAIQLLKAVAKREKITGEKKKISISGTENIGKAIDWFNFFKSKKQYEAYERQKSITVMNNFVSNLRDMANFGDLDKSSADKVKKIIRMIRRNPIKWRKIIEKHKLYDISGINMYDSDDQTVDLKNNADDIIEIIESEVGDIDELTEKEVEKIL